jgi:anti-sigma B factor antagonist
MSADPLLVDERSWADDWVPLRVTVRHAGDAVELVAAGDLDMATSALLPDTLLSVLEQAHREVRLDLSDVQFADLAGIDSLRRCQELARDRSCRCTIVRPSRQVRLVLELTDAGRHLAVAPDPVL